MPDDTREPTLPSITLRWTGQDAERVAGILRGDRVTRSGGPSAEVVLRCAEVLPEPRGWALVLASEADAEQVAGLKAFLTMPPADENGAMSAIARARLVQLDAPGDAGTCARCGAALVMRPVCPSSTPQTADDCEAPGDSGGVADGQRLRTALQLAMDEPSDVADMDLVASVARLVDDYHEQVTVASDAIAALRSARDDAGAIRREARAEVLMELIEELRVYPALWASWEDVIRREVRAMLADAEKERRDGTD